ncbi:hypothetical protein DRJ54_03565 [Candidatus Acetothermia bacterium]|nr:MAG: hypothetical protein DRJ54_03565 [Candidatus Acetothermia bacterium]
MARRRVRLAVITTIFLVAWVCIAFGYGPYTGITDSRGHFEIATSDPSKAITGTLEDCSTGRPLRGVLVRLTYSGSLGIGTRVRVSVSSYQEGTFPVKTMASSWMPGRGSYTTYDLGEICLTRVNMTDDSGCFRVQAAELPNTWVVGTVLRCPDTPLAGVQVQVLLRPKSGRSGISDLDDVGAVILDFSGYGQVEIEDFTVTSSMNYGQVERTIDVGTVCIGPLTPPSPVNEVTDETGRFSLSLPDLPGTSVTGRLTECGQRPLPHQEFGLIPVFVEGEIVGFTITAPGYEPVTITDYTLISLFGFTTYSLGDICLYPHEGEEIGEGEEVPGGEEGARPICTLIVRGRVADSSHDYPVSFSKVWLFILRDGDQLPLTPLSTLGRRPDAVTHTNHTNERSFNGHEFALYEKATYEFQLQWEGACPPRVVVVSLLWYDNQDLMAISSENQIGGRFVPVYLARLISQPDDPLLAQVGTAAARWRQTGPNQYTADPVDFFYGDWPPLARDSARVIGAGGSTSEDWARHGVDPDTFMNNCAHFYFWSYKAMRYFEWVAGQLGINLKPVLVSMFTNETTSCSSADVSFGNLAGGAGPLVNADAQVFLMTADNDSDPADNEKPDNTVWHELGHYWWLQIYGRFVPGNPPPDTNHGGWNNGSTTDSLQEGFAEFTSMLTCDHYGDPRPYLYNVGGHNHNLEVDIQLWGPPANREEFAVSGLLWDLHDGGGMERKPKGTASTVIEAKDYLILSDVQVFEVFVEEKPANVRSLYNALTNYPGYGLAVNDMDWDGVTDVQELFVAHGAYEDVNPHNHRWDGMAERLGFGGRLNRPKSPPLPQAYLVIHLVDESGSPVPLDGAVMHIDMRFSDPFSYYDYYDLRGLDSLRVYFVMPPDFYSATAYLTVEVPGQGRSEPLVITSEEYWRLFSEAGEAGRDYILEHTFVLAAP